MNEMEYRESLERELRTWRDRLLKVTSQIDHMPSIDKYKLTTHIEGLHILLSEMDERVAELRLGTAAEWFPELETASLGIKEPTFTFKEEKGVHSDYDFGG